MPQETKILLDGLLFPEGLRRHGQKLLTCRQMHRSSRLKL
jgi:hypothetical protein